MAGCLGTGELGLSPRQPDLDNHQVVLNQHDIVHGLVELVLSFTNFQGGVLLGRFGLLRILCRQRFFIGFGGPFLFLDLRLLIMVRHSTRAGRVDEPAGCRHEADEGKCDRYHFQFDEQHGFEHSFRESGDLSRDDSRADRFAGRK